MNYQHEKDNITLYTLHDCVYCLLAKKLLESKNIKYIEINLNNNLKLFDEIKEKYKYNTVPLIFINTKFIGGYTQLKNILDDQN